MLHNKDIAIISPYTLVNIGLKVILCEYFSAKNVQLYDSSKTFFENCTDQIDFFFVFPDTFLLNYDFFMPRKNKTILLIEGKEKENRHNFEYLIDILNDTNTLIESLQQHFESLCQRSENEKQEELSQREIEVLKLVALGLINKEIADRLNISFNTVLSHRKNITAKLGIKSVSGLSLYAMMNGYISSPE